MGQGENQSYKQAGVDLDAGYEAVRRIQKHVARTAVPGVLGELGGFGGLFAPDVAGMEQPVLVSGTDGVGTKLKLAFLMDRHDTVGIDCVAMCVNDIVCSGARPLFFLDYVACGKNRPQQIEAIVAGVAEGCVQAGCALIGGETAEMPGFYPEGEYDLAGFAVGLVDRPQMLGPHRVREGDCVLALPSSGAHSNGFSLIRKVLGLDGPGAAEALRAHEPVLGGRLGEALLAPTKIYVKPLLALLDRVEVHGAAHITGGGFFENIPRMLPKGLSLRMDAGSLPDAPLFSLLAQKGGLSRREMYNTFNMGVGFCVALPQECAEPALDTLAQTGERAFVLGRVVPGDEGVVL